MKLTSPMNELKTTAFPHTQTFVTNFGRKNKDNFILKVQFLKKNLEKDQFVSARYQ
jgi:hypothetical protein